MNRLIMQASVMVLFVLAISIAVSAQTAQQYRAEIPFSFEAAGKNHEAGKYTVGPLSQISAPGGIAIRNQRNGRARLLGVTPLSGDNNWDKPGTLTFLKVNGQYRLIEISTATFTMKMKVRGVKRSDLARRASPDSEIVTIAFKG